MRQIKFRAWDGKEMHDDAFSAKFKPAHEFDGLRLDAYYEPCFSNCNMKSLMQFTGLTDKNGVEIYEGDILQDYHLTDEVYKSGVYSRGEVVFYNSAFMQCYTHDDDKKYYERINNRDVVVGNIYQNPELLK